MFSPVHNYTINLSTTTDTVQGEGSQVITRLQPALKIPLTAHDIVVSLRSSFIYNTFPNVTTTIGNALYLKTTEMADFRVFVLPDGQYDVANLDSSFQFLIANDPTATELVGTFEINANIATQTIGLDNLSADKTLEFFFAGRQHSDGKSQPLSIHTLLGFNAETIITIPPKQNVYAPNTAAFNNVNIIRPICSLLQSGILVGGRALGVLADIPVNNTPGSQMVYQPNASQAAISEPSLAGTTIRDISITLTNENGQAIRTIGNEWAMTINISYKLPSVN